jgi:DedD protein
VSELTHDAEDGFHEIQLSGKQVVFLFMAGTVVSVMIFLCGVLVGRGVRASRGEDVDAPIAEASPSPGAAEVAATTATAEARPSADAPSPPAGAELTYDKDLASKDGPKDTLSRPTEAQKPAPASAAQPAAAAPQVKPVAPPPTAAAPPQTPAAADVPTSGRSGTWVLQVTALKNRDAANDMVRRLISRGYPAFVPAPPAGTPPMFRVQIGKYADRRAAEQVARRLEKEEQLRAVIKR